MTFRALCHTRLYIVLLLILMLVLLPTAEIGTSTRAIYDVEIAPGRYQLDVSNDSLPFVREAFIFQHTDGHYYTLRFKMATANLVHRIGQNKNKHITTIIARSVHDVDALAHKLAAFARMRRLDPAGFIVSFVQLGVTYRRDEFMERTYPRAYPDYHKYSVETLFDRDGDCEDKVVLAASLLKAAGYRVGYVEIPGHIVLAIQSDTGAPSSFVHRDRSYQLWEMTQPHALPGELSIMALESPLFTEVPS